VEHVIFRALALNTGQPVRFIVERKDGEPLVYESMQMMKDDYEADIVRVFLLPPFPQYLHHFTFALYISSSP
jgi:tyrosyl-tRNA synthetase